MGVVILGGAAVVTLLVITAWIWAKKGFVWANLFLSLVSFVGRSSIIYYTNPLRGTVIAENQTTLSVLRDSFVVLLLWVFISGVVFGFKEILVPFIRANFYIQRTPPGVPDKILHINNQDRRVS